MPEKMPNYDRCSLDELKDALGHIDHDKYPDRVVLIKAAIDSAPLVIERTKPGPDKVWSGSGFSLGCEAIFWAAFLGVVNF